MSSEPLASTVGWSRLYGGRLVHAFTSLLWTKENKGRHIALCGQSGSLPRGQRSWSLGGDDQCQRCKARLAR